MATLRVIVPRSVIIVGLLSNLFPEANDSDEDDDRIPMAQQATLRGPLSDVSSEYGIPWSDKLPVAAPFQIHLPLTPSPWPNPPLTAAQSPTHPPSILSQLLVTAQIPTVSQ